MATGHPRELSKFASRGGANLLNDVPGSQQVALSWSVSCHVPIAVKNTAAASADDKEANELKERQVGTGSPKLMALVHASESRLHVAPQQLEMQQTPDNK
jgi:hypothetical protein